MFVVDVLIIIVLTSWLVYFWNLYVTTQKLKRFRGPPKLPLIGNALTMMDSKTVLQNITKDYHTYGSFVKYQVGPIRQLLMISDPEFLKYVLGNIKFVNRSIDYRFLKNLVGDGLLLSSGLKWKRRRRVITPTFNFNTLEKFVENFEAPVDIFLNSLKKHTSSNSTEIYDTVNLLALDVICATSMGVFINAQSDKGSEYVYGIKEVSRIYHDRSFSPIKMYDFFYQFTSDFREEQKHLKVLHSYCDSIIQKKRDEIKNGMKGDYQSFLDCILEAKDENGNTLTDREIRNEVNTLIIGGHDTTTSAISFALYSLANNPEIQTKVLEETCSILGRDKNAPITMRDLNQMKYLEQVVKETIRLYPSVPLMARELEEDLHYGDISLPKGLTLTIFVFGLHRDKKYYPNPEKFDPSRFDSENESKTAFTYIPFSAGPRNCIGIKFAYLEVKYVIARVLRNFELSPAIPNRELNLKYETILKSADGIHINIKERKHL